MYFFLSLNQILPRYLLSSLLARDHLPRCVMSENGRGHVSRIIQQT